MDDATTVVGELVFHLQVRMASYINTFVHNNLETGFIRSAFLCRFLLIQQNLRGSTGISVSEVVKAGSLGHGTAVQGNFDVDLVIYSRGK